MAAPLKLAIIGAGPSSFYVASRLLSLLPQSSPQASQLSIHMYDRLWAPHGLVRYGVAPDHPEVKNCTHKFDEAAADPRLHFFGNINIGTPSAPVPNALNLPLSSLLPHYTHLLLATGCTVPKLHPDVPPSQHCIPALSLVHWYTQHPAHTAPPPLDKLGHVTIIGQGNVSLDIARMLLTPPSELAKYDVPEPVLSELARSSIKHVSIVGRRGPLQAAFTVKELREMLSLPDTALSPLPPELLNPPADVVLTRQQSRTLQLLRKGSVQAFGSTRKTWSLDFFRAPTGLAPPSGAGASPLLTLAHTMLDADTRAVPTRARDTRRTDLVVTALGHHGEAAGAWHDPALGHVRTLDGRVVDGAGRTVRRVYASGWAAMGAHGVLASTLRDAYGVAETMLEDHFRAGEKARTEGYEVTVMAEGDVGDEPPPEVRDGVRNGVVPTYKDWKKVDAEEVRRGMVLGKERERMNWTDASSFLVSGSK